MSAGDMAVVGSSVEPGISGDKKFIKLWRDYKGAGEHSGARVPGMVCEGELGCDLGSGVIDKFFNFSYMSECTADERFYAVTASLRECLKNYDFSDAVSSCQDQGALVRSHQLSEDVISNSSILKNDHYQRLF